MNEVPAGTTSLVGRERDLDELRATVDEAAAGKGRLLFLTGEPGIGKTRMAQEVAAHAPATGSTVLWGNCWEGEGAPADWPWIQVLRAYLRDRTVEEFLEELGPSAADVAAIVPELSGVPKVSNHADVTPFPSPPLRERCKNTFASVRFL